MEEKQSEPPPSYSQAVLHGESSSSPAPVPAPAPTATVIYGTTVQGPDIAYLKSPGGILKIIEAVSEIVVW